MTHSSDIFDDMVVVNCSVESDLVELKWCMLESRKERMTEGGIGKGSQITSRIFDSWTLKKKKHCKGFFVVVDVVLGDGFEEMENRPLVDSIEW